jgi:hypothetical protein
MDNAPILKLGEIDIRGKHDGLASFLANPIVQIAVDLDMQGPRTVRAFGRDLY